MNAKPDLAQRLAQLPQSSLFHVVAIAAAMCADKQAGDATVPQTKLACDVALENLPNLKRWEQTALAGLARELSKA